MPVQVTLEAIRYEQGSHAGGRLPKDTVAGYWFRVDAEPATRDSKFRRNHPPPKGFLRIARDILLPVAGH